MSKLTIEDVEEIMQEAPQTLAELHEDLASMPPEHQKIWGSLLSRLVKETGN